MTDLQIIDLYWQRSEQAIAESDLKYGSYCFAVSNNILADALDAEECVSDTWLRAWTAIPPERPDRLKLFFAKITRNLSLDRLKVRLAQKRGGGEMNLILDELEDCVSGSVDMESEYIAKELGVCINRFVRQLPEREANLFVRRYFYGENLEMVAMQCGINAHNAAVILSRVRKKLQYHLREEGYFV